MIPRWRKLRILSLACWMVAVISFHGSQTESGAFALPLAADAKSASPELYRADRFLIKPKARTEPGALARFHSAQQCKVLQTFPGIGNLQVLAVPEGESVQDLIAKYKSRGLVDFAEPDFVRQLNSTMPNDPKFLDGTLWGLYNYGQNAGTPHADIDAVEAWDVFTSASNIVVAILDTGIRYTHEDLAANIWTNPSDGSHGTNTIAGTALTLDDNGHGTRMAGVIGAVGNNGTGVVGVAWSLQMMACKAFDASGSSSDSAIIAGMEYARVNGARIISASFDSTAFSESLSNAIYTARTAGIIFVASAGNNSTNIDPTPHYPACYGIDNVVSVAYTTRNDGLGFFSNYGATNVDLAAPGDQIYTTSYGSDSSYYPPAGLGINLAGTSFAAAYVSGALALMLTKYPSETHQQIISRLLNATDPVPALAGKCVTGGRLNLRKALSPPIHLIPLGFAPNGSFQFRIAGDPNRDFVIQAAPDLVSFSPIFTNKTAASGTFDFNDLHSTDFSRRFYRATAAP